MYIEPTNSWEPMMKPADDEDKLDKFKEEICTMITGLMDDNIKLGVFLYECVERIKVLEDKMD